MRNRHSFSEPAGEALAERLLGAAVDLGVGQGAERMVDDDRRQIGQAQRVALHQRLVQKLAGDDDRRRAAQGFETDGVMRTARRARASIADRRENDVVLGGDLRDERRIGIL